MADRTEALQAFQSCWQYVASLFPEEIPDHVTHALQVAFFDEPSNITLTPRIVNGRVVSTDISVPRHVVEAFVRQALEWAKYKGTPLRRLAVHLEDMPSVVVPS